MSQSFHVLLCVRCKTFQVQIVKKSSNKWNCKICDSKQSVQQVFAKGTGAECRDIVQRLNEARGKREESQSSKSLARVAQDQSGGEQEESRYFSKEHFDGELLHDHHQQQRFHEGSSSSSSSGVQDHKSQGWQSRGIKCVPREKSKWTKFLDDNEN